MKKLPTLLTLLAASATLTFAQETTPAPAPSASPAEPPHHHGGGPGGPEGPGGPRMTPEEHFKKLDTNGDGYISLEEFMAGPMAQKAPERAKERFTKLDTNSDGKLSIDELKAGRHPDGPRGHKGLDGRGPKGNHGGGPEASPAPAGTP